MAWQEPKADWVANPKNPVAEDFNRIEENTAFLKADIETKKGAIVDALNTVGLASSLDDTHATLASRITGANQGTKVITPSTANQAIVKGFHSGQGYVKGDANLIGANIRSGKSIFGVTGTFDKVYTATEAQILAALGIPSFPVGSPTVTGRFKTVLGTGSNMYAPTGKTWIIYNSYHMPWATDSVGGSPIKPVANYPLVVLEIDIPSVYLAKPASPGTYDFGAADVLVCGGHISYPNSGRLIWNSQYNNGKFFSNDIYGYHRYSNTIPFKGTLWYEYMGVFAFTVSGWNITTTKWNLSIGQTINVGTVPASEQWLMTFGWWGSYITLNLNGVKAYDSTSTPYGVYLVPPGTSVTIKNDSGDSPGGAQVAILKLSV